MDNSLKESLKSIGLSDKEARVYYALLNIGVSSVVTIAKKAEIKRPTAYVVLEDLMEKGIVSEVSHPHKKLYRAVEPRKLFEQYEDSFNKAKQLLPQIEAIAKEESYKPHVVLYEGVEGTQEALAYGINKMKGQEIVGYYAKTTSEILKKYKGYERYNEALYDNRIKMRGIAPKDRSLKEFRDTDKDYGRTFREMPNDKYSSDIAIEMGDTFVRFFDPINLQSLIIENPAITKTMKEIFEMSWEKLEAKKNSQAK